MKRFTSKTQKTGELGECLAEQFLVSKGFTVIERNATYQGGEIDIIATKSERIHFIEVKTIKMHVSRSSVNVSQGRHHSQPFHVKQTYNPFQNVSRKKIQKMSNTALLWLSHRGVSRETPWQMDAVGVFLDDKAKKAKISYLPNINM